VADARFDPGAILRVLHGHGVRFVVIGGVAAITQGYPLPTDDLDLTPARDEDNVGRLAAALAELGAKLRISGGAPVDFPIEPRYLASVDSWTLTTTYGPLDILFAPEATRGFDDLRRDAAETELGEGLRVLVASLRDVIRMKEASNRPKDQAQLPALRQTLEVIRERERRGRG
jgi:hypothetical protein